MIGSIPAQDRPVNSPALVPTTCHSEGYGLDIVLIFVEHGPPSLLQLFNKLNWLR